MRIELIITTGLLFLYNVNLKSQNQIKLQINGGLRHTQWLDNNEYIRRPFGPNTGYGLKAIYQMKKVGFSLAHFNYNERFRDVVKDDVRFYEYFDTITYHTQFKYTGIGLLLNIIDENVQLSYECNVFRSIWKKTDMYFYGPRGKVEYIDFNAKAQGLKPGIVLRNGINIGYKMKRFEIGATLFTDVLLKPYWDYKIWKFQLEPYSRAALGIQVGFGYNLTL